MTQSSESFDAIVVGSGISGGWAAKELTEQGLRVLLLERGKNIEHSKDYVNATQGAVGVPAPRRPHARDGRARIPVLKRDYPLNEKNLDWWVNEKESPYTEVKRFDWYRGYHVGGRSLTWGRQSYRWSDFDFEANAQGRHRRRLADPLRRHRAVVRPRREARRHQPARIEGLPQLPDGQFQPAMPLNCVEEVVAGRIAKQFDGTRRIIPGRVANLTQPLPGPRALPVPQRVLARLSVRRLLQHAVLDAAGRGGDGQADAEAVLDRHRGRLRQGPQARDRRARASTRVTNADHGLHRAKVVFLCASTLNSTWLLMRSATDVWPGGLGSSSRRARPQPDGSPLPLRRRRHRRRASRTSTVYGRRPTGFYIPRFRNLVRRQATTTCAASATRAARAAQGWARAVAELGVGAAFKDEMADAGPVANRRAPRSARCCRTTRTRSRSIRAKKDKWGLPVLTIDCATGENERLMRQGHDERHGRDARGRAA